MNSGAGVSEKQTGRFFLDPVEAGKNEKIKKQVFENWLDLNVSGKNCPEKVSPGSGCVVEKTKIQNE